MAASDGGGGATQPKSKEAQELKEMAAVSRSQMLRANMNWIPESSYKMRREYFAGKVRPCGGGGGGGGATAAAHGRERKGRGAARRSVRRAIR